MKIILLLLLLLLTGCQTSTPTPAPPVPRCAPPKVEYRYEPEPEYDASILRGVEAGCARFVHPSACPVRVIKKGFRDWHVICRRGAVV